MFKRLRLWWWYRKLMSAILLLEEEGFLEDEQAFDSIKLLCKRKTIKKITQVK